VNLERRRERERMSGWMDGWMDGWLVGVSSVAKGIFDLQTERNFGSAVEVRKSTLHLPTVNNLKKNDCVFRVMTASHVFLFPCPRSSTLPCAVDVVYTDTEHWL
jgi:hypothetical protein